MKKKILKTTVIVQIITLAIIIFLIIYSILCNNDFSSISLNNISKTKAQITKYAVYGNHFNFEGNLKLPTENITNRNIKTNLILKNQKGKEITLHLNYKLHKDTLNFKTSNFINSGINLESIDINDYKFYIKITDNITGFSTYYALENNTDYKNLNYYTITKNNSNKKVDILWDKDGLNLKVTKIKLPENVYDIVIDQGHGGKSSGAIGNGYTEATITYFYGIKLKQSLEKLGLKVLLTRNNLEETVGNYNKDGRAVIPNLVKAKYCFSIHINSSPIFKESSGVEIYCPNFADLTLGKSLADNIVNIANSCYSRNTSGYVSDGVYVLTFDEATIDECKDEALEKNLQPYSISTSTPLFFMIREVGGISTNAYVDGRDEEVGKNLYYNSNITAESYLLELGYISNKEDINNVVNNIDKYVEAITKSIKDHLGL